MRLSPYRDNADRSLSRADRSLGLIRLAGVALALAGLLWLGYAVLKALGEVGNADRSEAVARHEAFLDEVPIYPGAVFFGDWTSGSREYNRYPEGFGPITSYSTEREFMWDGAAPDERKVAEWYLARTPKRCLGWTGGPRPRPGQPRSDWTAGFRCVKHSIAIDPSADGLTINVHDAVAAEHHVAREGGPPSEPFGGAISIHVMRIDPAGRVDFAVRAADRAAVTERDHAGGGLLEYEGYRISVLRIEPRRRQVTFRVTRIPD